MTTQREGRQNSKSAQLGREKGLRMKLKTLPVTPGCQSKGFTRRLKTNKPHLNHSMKRQFLLGLNLHTALPQLRQITIEAASYLYQLSRLLIVSLASVQLHIHITEYLSYMPLSQTEKEIQMSCKV